MNLVDDIDVAATNAAMEKYQLENASAIVLHESKRVRWWVTVVTRALVVPCSTRHDGNLGV